MKAKDLVAMLEEFNPEDDIAICSCGGCYGSPSVDISTYVDNRTTWNSKTKSVEHKMVIVLQGD